MGKDNRAANGSPAPGASRYIAGPLYDWALFLLPPSLALLLGIAISDTALANREFEFGCCDTTSSALFIGVFVHAHLFIVFFRSHGNPEIFKRHRYRFLAVPVLLYAAMMASPWVLISVSVLATFWDVYHSGLQTFGFARIYDRKHGNDPTVGRRLDLWLNHLLYAGPILAGATMMDHFEDFEEFSDLGSAFFTSIPAAMQSHQRYYAWAVIGAGSLFLVYYAFAQWRLHRQGHSISLLKTWLLVSTGFCSVYTWGFNSFGEAFFIMNLFHGLQYFGLIWASERKQMTRLFRLEGSQLARTATFLLFVSIAFGYGIWVEALDTDLEHLWAITLVVSILHFWYDGFIWSVRRDEV